MPTDINISQLVINKLTQAQYNEAQSAGNISESELYFVTDDSIPTHPLATTTTPGLVMVDGTAGVGVNTENGNLFIKCASNNEIDDKEHSYNPITPENLDYAVKAALVNNANSINSTERKAISEWLGMVSSTCIHKETGDITDLAGTESCRYIIGNEVTGMPIENEWWFVDVLSNGYTDMTLTAYCVSKNPTQHIRVCKNNVWGDWVNIATGEDAMVRIDENATGGLTNDTVDFWANKGTGYSWTSERDQVIAQPGQYGFIISYVNGSDVFQIFRDQEAGVTYFRSGDSVNNWFQNWKEVVTADGNGNIKVNGIDTVCVNVRDDNSGMGLYTNGLGSDNENVWIDQAGDAYFTEVNIGTKDNHKKVATEEYVTDAIQAAFANIAKAEEVAF